LRVLVVLGLAFLGRARRPFLALGIENAVYGRNCAFLFSGCAGYFLLAGPVVFVLTLGVGWWTAR